MINDYSGMLTGCEGNASFAYSLFRFLEGLLQTISEDAEGPCGRLSFIPVNQSRLGTAGMSLQVISEETAAVSILMAIDTEILPIAPVGRIVVMISIPMVNRQQMPVGRIKRPAAFGTNQAMDGQGSLTVSLVPSPFCIPFQLPDEIFRGTARHRAAFYRYVTSGAARSRTIGNFCHGIARDPQSGAGPAFLIE